MFTGSSDADQNTSDYGLNEVVNVSANISVPNNTTTIESYMYRVPEWYLGSLVKLVGLCVVGIVSMSLHSVC